MGSSDVSPRGRLPGNQRIVNDSQRYEAVFFRGGALRPASDRLVAGTWNIEGFADEKLITLQHYMTNMGVDLLCIQETHKTKSDVFTTDGGFLVILSGSSETETVETAGVGFLVAPHLRHSVIGFCQKSSRMASLKLRVSGGKVPVFSVYAPHNGKPYEERSNFYSELSCFMSSASGNGPKVALGDFNARLHVRQPGEDSILGEHIFGNPMAVHNTDSNRSLLMELCAASTMAVGNTFFASAPEHQVTCYNVGSHPHDTLDFKHFGQLDFVLVPQSSLHLVRAVSSHKYLALPSHHFLVTSELDIALAKRAPQSRGPRPDKSSLNDKEAASAFRSRFEQLMEDEEENEEDRDTDAQELNWLSSRITTCMLHAAEETLPLVQATPHRAWISGHTLRLIDSRSEARRNGNLLRERALNIEVKRSVKKDRDQWLTSLLEKGPWDQVKDLRRGVHHRQGRLKDMQGRFVSSEDRAETLADYLETVQWAVRPLEPVLADNCLGPEIDVDSQDISENEVVKAASKLKVRKAAGSDNLPPEFWKQICKRGSKACQWALELCRKCWSRGAVPEKWHEARVAMIFKKGDVADCGNYRPIPLLQI